MTAKEYLSQYRELNREIDSIWTDIQRLRCLATRTNSGDVSAMPKATKCKSEANFAGVVEKLIKEEEKMNKKIDKLLVVRKNVESAINAVEDSTLRVLLNYRYICGYTFERIAVEMHYSYRNVCYLHGKALLVVKIA